MSNNTNIHNVTALTIKKRVRFKKNGEFAADVITLEVYDKNHNLFEVILYGRQPIIINEEDPTTEERTNEY